MSLKRIFLLRQPLNLVVSIKETASGSLKLSVWDKKVAYKNTLINTNKISWLYD